MENSIHHSKIIFNHLKKLNLCQIYSHTALKHIMAILISVFSFGFKGKTVDFQKKGFLHNRALKTNRILYPCGIKQKMNEFALHFRKTDADVSFVTAGNRQYYVYRYEGSLNGIENAVVLLSYPKDAFHNPKALKAFICTDVSLSTQEILDRYMCRWSIEVYFRQSKDRLAFSKYQIRSSKGIRRYWLIMSLAHFLCCTEAKEDKMVFEKRYKLLQKTVQEEQIGYIYQCGAKGIPLENVLALVG